MKTIALLFLWYVPFLCCSCGSTQGIRTSTDPKTGVVTKTHFQNTGVLNKFDGLAQKLTDGEVQLEQVVINGNNNAPVESLYAYKSFKVLWEGLTRAEIAKDNNATKVNLKGTKDPNLPGPTDVVPPGNPFFKPLPVVE